MAAADSLLTPLSSCTAHGRSSWQQVERRRHASSAHGRPARTCGRPTAKRRGHGSAQEARRRLPEVALREESLATLLARSKEIGRKC